MLQQFICPSFATAFGTVWLNATRINAVSESHLALCGTDQPSVVLRPHARLAVSARCSESIGRGYGDARAMEVRDLFRRVGAVPAFRAIPEELHDGQPTQLAAVREEPKEGEGMSRPELERLAAGGFEALWPQGADDRVDDGEGG